MHKINVNNPMKVSNIKLKKTIQEVEVKSNVDTTMKVIEL